MWWPLFVLLSHGQPSLQEQFLRVPHPASPDTFWGSNGHRWERYDQLQINNQYDLFPTQNQLWWLSLGGALGTAETGMNPWQEASGFSLESGFRLSHARYWIGVSPNINITTSQPKIHWKELVAGVNLGSVSLWGGLRSRWIGNGHFGNLLYGDETLPLPSIVVDWTQANRKRWGRVYLESGVGVFHRPRADVNRPLLMHMDLRYKPYKWLELSATRLSILGGEGRPLPGVGQLIFPSEPHVYDDPEKELPDQDELASLEVYFRYPLTSLGPFDAIEAWYQYGAEDAIQKRVGVIPYISLAGVASLGGITLHTGSLSWSFEAADIVDDRFRWYRGHRIYHEGFSVEERWLGYPSGGDASVITAGARFLKERTGAAFMFEHKDRVGAIQSINGVNFALPKNEIRNSIGMEYWYTSGVNRLTMGAEVGSTVNHNFVPEANTMTVNGQITYTRHQVNR